MASRRRFIQLTVPTLAVLGGARLLLPSRSNADQASATATATASATPTGTASPTTAGDTIWAPLIIRQPMPTATSTPTPTVIPTAIATPPPVPTDQPQPTAVATPTDLSLPPSSGDAPLLGSPSGTADQAVRWLIGHSNSYTEAGIWEIVSAYQRIGEAGGVDWFLALAQMCLETGSLTSWWCQRPRRNPAGIGVTGRSIAGTADAPPNGDAFRWAFRDGLWYEGVSFAKWDTDAVAAHIGRVLAYALPAAQTDNQQQLLDWALYVRPLSASLRGSSQTIIDLNGRWAVPGTTYGQSIIALRDRMRAA